MSFWTDRNVFVTGATGLLGSHLTEELLARGARVTVLVRDWVPDSRTVSSGTLTRNGRIEVSWAKLAAAINSVAASIQAELARDVICSLPHVGVTTANRQRWTERITPEAWS